MYFDDLKRKLIDLARERVRAGEFTERGLARKCAVSQPHMHNVLKEIRAFSHESCDRLMRALDLEVADLLWRLSGEHEADVRAVPMVRSRIGPGTDAFFTVFRGYVPMPGWLLRNLVDPVTARLAPDLVLPGELATNDLVLLDQNPEARAAPGAGIWIVAESAGLRARYVRKEEVRLYAGNSATQDDPQKWLAIPLRGRNMLDIVRARIVWIGREMEKEAAGPAQPAGEADRSDSGT